MAKFSHWSRSTFILSLIPVFFFSNCGQDQKRQPEIVLTVMTSAHPYFQAVIAEWQKLASEKGFNLTVMDPNFDNARQLKIVEDIITRQPSGVAFAPIDSRIAVKMLKKIRAAGIPVIAYNIRPAEDVVPTVVGEDFQGGTTAGVAGAHYFRQRWPMRQPVIGIVGQVGIPEVDKREQGFMAGLRTVFPQAELRQKVNGYGVRDRALKAAEDLLQAHPDVNIIFGINDDSALAILDALKERNARDVLVAGIGGSEPVIRELVKPESMFKIVVANPPKDMADFSYQLLANAITGQTEFQLIEVPFVLIDPEQATEWLETQFPAWR